MRIHVLKIGAGLRNGPPAAADGSVALVHHGVEIVGADLKRAGEIVVGLRFGQFEREHSHLERNRPDRLSSGSKPDAGFIKSRFCVFFRFQRDPELLVDAGLQIERLKRFRITDRIFPSGKLTAVRTALFVADADIFLPVRKTEADIVVHGLRIDADQSVVVKQGKRLQRPQRAGTAVVTSAGHHDLDQTDVKRGRRKRIPLFAPQILRNGKKAGDVLQRAEKKGRRLILVPRSQDQEFPVEPLRGKRRIQREGLRSHRVDDAVCVKFICRLSAVPEGTHVADAFPFPAAALQLVNGDHGKPEQVFDSICKRIGILHSRKLLFQSEKLFPHQILLGGGNLLSGQRFRIQSRASDHALERPESLDRAEIQSLLEINGNGGFLFPVRALCGDFPPVDEQFVTLFPHGIRIGEMHPLSRDGLLHGAVERITLERISLYFPFVADDAVETPAPAEEAVTAPGALACAVRIVVDPEPRRKCERFRRADFFRIRKFNPDSGFCLKLCSPPDFRIQNRHLSADDPSGRCGGDVVDDSALGIHLKVRLKDRLREIGAPCARRQKQRQGKNTLP